MKKYLRALFFLVSVPTVFLCQGAFGQGRVDIGKSFANISKLGTAGTYEPGDTVEIRVTIAVKTQGTPTIIDQVQVLDAVPAKTTYITGSMRIATNEGILYKGPFTEAFDSDPARFNAGNIIINVGNNATNSAGGRIKSDSSRPSFFNSHCIMMVCYKVRINPATNYYDTITIRGSVRYRPVSPSGSTVNSTFPEYKLLVFPNNGLCQNGTDISAASDFGGSFGFGTDPNRAAPLSFTTSYVKQNISTGQPNDYNYAIVKNSSPTSLTNPNPGLPNAANRVFGFWDIAGDHTNSTNTAAGNAPPAAAQSAGYFVLINASYSTDVAYQETLTNLCPNTYYEFSAWFRNVCPRCGCDSMGRGSGANGYIRGPGNDSSGVKPNLNFEVDGLAFYTTGDIQYDRSRPWVKYGFTFITRPGQTTANFVIRNNSPGGGGNDWAIDDIKVAHCGPDLEMNYHPYVIGCKESQFAVTLSDTIRFAYNSYTYFKWQKSNVGGTIWTDMTGPGTSGIGTPVLVNGMYEYVTNLPTFWATAADSGIYYRVVVATTLGNLNSNCSYKDGTSTMVSAITCGTILNGSFTQFRGTLTDKKTYLTWSTANEENIAHYTIEKSRDGRTFAPLDNVTAKKLPSAYYNYTDPEEVNGDFYYRIKMTQPDGLFKYSNIVLVSTNSYFGVNNIQNPFSSQVKADIVMPENGKVNIVLYNDKGQQVKVYRKDMNKGFNQVILDGLSGLTHGMYFISFEYNNQFERRKLMH